MKKTKFLYLLFILLIPITVSAEGKEYRFYYLEKQYSNEFYEEGQNIEEYPYKSNIWKYSDKLQTTTEKPLIKEDIIKETQVLTYQEQEKVQYIIIDQTYSDSKINVQEIEVYDKDKKIEYKVDCKTCPTEFFSLVQNTKLSYEYNYINNNSKIIVDLQKKYFPEDLILKIYLSGVNNKIARFRVTVNNTNDINDKYYRFQVDKKLSPLVQVIQPLKDIEHTARYTATISQIKDVETIENAKILTKSTEYTYKTRQYLYYKEVPHYIDGYYTNLPGLLKDETTYREDLSDQVENEIIEENKIEEVENIKIEYQTKEIKVPIIQEKVKYITEEVIVEVPKEVEKVVEKEVIKEKKQKENYVLRYGIYLIFTPFLRKLLKFRD